METWDPFVNTPVTVPLLRGQGSGVPEVPTVRFVLDLVWQVVSTDFHG